MSQENNYWLRRLDSGRFSRRRFVGGAALAGVGAAGLGLVGCGDDDSGGSTATTSGGSPTGSSPTAGSASPTAAAKQKGGIYRNTSANGTYDTFDVDRSRFSPFAVQMGYTNLGLVNYASFTDGKLEGAFASKWEQPDATTMTFTLRDNLFWQNKAPVNGRQATVDDIVFFIQRNKDGKLQDGTVDPNFYRASDYASVQSVTATDSKTVTVKFSKPNPFFLGTLAGSYAKLQAPEAVKQFEKTYTNFSPDLIIGTGAYILTQFTADGHVQLRRFDKYYRDVWIDGLDYIPLFTDNAALQSAFEQKQIDQYAPRTKAVLDDLQARYKGQIYNEAQFDVNPWAGTYYGGSAPWNNPNLIGAIFRSIDRNALSQQLVQGQAALSGSIPPVQQPFAITEKELITYPGYLADHAKDLSEAKAMWAAGGGPALGRILIDIPDIWEGAYAGVSALIQNQLKANLGDQFDTKIEPYSTITGKLVKQQYGNGSNNIWYGWISDVNKLEPSFDLWTNFNSASPQFPYLGGVKIDKVDTLTNQIITELDATKRADLCKQIDVELIKAYGAGVPYNLDHISTTLSWNYYHGTEATPFITSPNFGNTAYFDQKDPTWSGRQA